MAQSNPIASFGIHQATVKDLATHKMFTMLILDSAEPDFSQDLVDLRGGSSAFPWASAPGEANGEIAMTIKQYDAGVLKFFSPYIAGSISENESGDALGDVTAITNVVGTSAVDSGAGIASIAAETDEEASLKFGDYIAVVVSPTTIDLYVNVNIDGYTYEDDALKITSTPITIPDASTVAFNGVEFTGGTSVAMTIGDKAAFSVRPINTYNLTHYIGKSAAAPLEFELTIVGEKIGTKIRVAKYSRCIAGGGAGLKFMYKDWATFETTIKLLQDATLGYVGVETMINR